MPAGVSVHDQLGAGVQSCVRYRIEVPDDDVGPIAGLEQRVGSPVDADEHRTHVGDVGAQCRQVGAVIETADNDEDVTTAKVDGDIGQRRRVGEQVTLLAQVFERVLGEALELVTNCALCRVELLLEGMQRLGRAFGNDLVAPQDLRAVDAQHLTLAYEVHDLRTHVVDQGDAGRRDQQGADVGVTA